MGRRQRSPRRFEEACGQRLPLGGVNGYRGVRGGQGRGKNKYQGTAMKKKLRTELFDTPLEAAVALAQKKDDLEDGTFVLPCEAKLQPAATTATSKRPEIGVYLGDLLKLQRQAMPTVKCVLLSQQQAAAASARGVVVAYAELLA